MAFNFLKLLGIALVLLTLVMAWRTRRDLERGETQWGRALFHRSHPIRHAETPFRFWVAMALNVVSVLLFALAALFIMRAGILHLAVR